MEAINFEKIIIKQSLSNRGGGIEINLSTLGFKGERMAVYQHHLGGGILGSIGVNDSIRSQASNVRLQLQWSSEFKKLDEIGEQLKEYMHNLTNHRDVNWESATFEENQRRPRSAY
jgi:hypothetical protein